MVIILLERQDLVSPGCVLAGGNGRREWVDKEFALIRLGRNLTVVLLRFLRSGNGEWWMAERLK